MANTVKYGKWELFNHRREELNFRSRANVKLVRNGKTIAVVKTKKQGSQTDEEFKNEVEILASLDHPNIVKVIDTDLKAGTPYMIMEFIEGGTIKDRDLSTWTIRERLTCFNQVCEAVAYVHSKGFRKSDIYHGNVFLREDKTPVIGDFEHAKPLEGYKQVGSEMSSLAQLFWEMMYGENFSAKMFEERRLNEEIEEVTNQLEELKQQKAELLN